MKPELWGPYLWRSIHMIALGYPDNPTEEDANNYHDFFTNLWKIIPCLKCALNYKRHLEELPIDHNLVSKKALFEWTVSLHNIVNQELGKPTMTKEHAFQLYTTVEKKSVDNFAWIVVMICVVTFLLCLVFYFKRKGT